MKHALTIPWTLSTSQQPQQQIATSPDCNLPQFNDVVRLPVYHRFTKTFFFKKNYFYLHANVTYQTVLKTEDGQQVSKKYTLNSSFMNSIWQLNQNKTLSYNIYIVKFTQSISQSKFIIHKTCIRMYSIC